MQIPHPSIHTTNHICITLTHTQYAPKHKNNTHTHTHTHTQTPTFFQPHTRCINPPAPLQDDRPGSGSRSVCVCVCVCVRVCVCVVCDLMSVCALAHMCGGVSLL